MMPPKGTGRPALYKVGLSIPEDLKDKLIAAAFVSRRSICGEAEFRLEKTFTDEYFAFLNTEDCTNKVAQEAIEKALTILNGQARNE